MKSLRKRSLLTLLICCWLSAPVLGVENQLKQSDHAVVLLYHHVADDTPFSTSISVKDFVAHLDHLNRSGYQVLPLSQILGTLQNNGLLPDKTVAITFDDAYASIFENAWPELKRRELPFTIFVNTAAIKSQPTTYMSWSQLETLSQSGVAIANHSHSHQHLVSHQNDQSWSQNTKLDIQKADELLQQKLGVKTQLFAYPYGEFEPVLQNIVAASGLLGFGQHSGAISSESDFSALPRFPIGGSYSAISRLDTAIKSRPLQVNSEPANGYVLNYDKTTFELNITVVDGPDKLSALACYPSSGANLALQPSGNRQFQIQLTQLNTPGRYKINCTVPDPNNQGVFFWWSYLIMKPPSAGSWYTQ